MSNEKEVEIICCRCLYHMSGPEAAGWVRWELCERCRLNWWPKKYKWLRWLDDLFVRIVMGESEKDES